MQRWEELITSGSKAAQTALGQTGGLLLARQGQRQRQEQGCLQHFLLHFLKWMLSEGRILDHYQGARTPCVGRSVLIKPM